MSDAMQAEISRREFFTKLSPLGKVTLEAGKCTGCGLCAAECPTGALSFTTGGDTTYKMLFRHGACVACNQCVVICPEKCLHLERVVETGKISEQTVLFEDNLVKCPECGRPFATRAMMDSVRARLAAAGQAIPPQLGLCPECKVSVRLRL